LSFLERGFPADYIDRYPQLLQQVTCEQVNQAIQDYFDPSACKRVAVGTLNQAASTPKNEEQLISLRIDAPNPSWKLAIQAVYAKDDRLIVVAQLQKAADGIFPQVITAVHDSVTIAASDQTQTDFYILGKTWDWGERPNQFAIESITDIDAVLQDAQVLFKR
jgi:glutamine synthetase adenylyltransferase